MVGGFHTLYTRFDTRFDILKKLWYNTIMKIGITTRLVLDIARVIEADSMEEAFQTAQESLKISDLVSVKPKADLMDYQPIRIIGVWENE